MTTHNTMNSNGPQLVRRQTTETKANTASRRCRAYEVPSQVMPSLRRAIVGAFAARRSVKKIAAEYQVTQALVLELVLRDQSERAAIRMRALEDRVA